MNHTIEATPDAPIADGSTVPATAFWSARSVRMSLATSRPVAHACLRRFAMAERGLGWDARHVDLQKLAATPDKFQAALDTLGADRFAERPAPSDWSPSEILTHVRAADAVIAPRFLQVLVRPGIALPDFDERMVGDRLARAQQTDRERITVFSARRAELVALLATVSEGEGELRGDHETKGAISITDLYGALAGHEEEHLQQLATAVAALTR